MHGRHQGGWAVLGLATWAFAAWATPEAARPSDSLVESTGVNTHFNYAGSPYDTLFPEVSGFLLDGGLRVIREAYLGDPASLNDGGTFVPSARIAALVDAGVRINLLCDLQFGTPQVCHDVVAAFGREFPGAIASVEGPNEPDGFWPSLYPAGYKGEGFPDGSVLFQEDLFTAMKSDPATAGIPVYGIALGLAGQPPCVPSHPNPLGDAGQLARSVDFGNFHPYPSGNPWHPDISYDFVPNSYYHQTLLPSAELDPTPSTGLTGFDDDVCQDSEPYSPKPMVATESGIETTSGGVPESHLAALVPRVVLENYRLGIVQTLLYELIDSGGQQFGLIAADGGPRPSYTAVAFLLNRLADPGPSFVPGTLDYTLTVSPVTLDAGDPAETFDRLSYIHHLLFQKHDGTFELVVWHEIATDETYPTYASLSPPAMPGVLQFHQPIQSATATTIDALGAPTTVALDLDAGLTDSGVGLMVTERFEIIEVTLPGLPSDGGIDAGIDAGAATDAGGVDAGSGLGSSAKGGCGCNASAGGTALILLAALGFLARRHPWRG